MANARFHPSLLSATPGRPRTNIFNSNTVTRIFKSDIATTAVGKTAPVSDNQVMLKHTTSLSNKYEAYFAKAAKAAEAVEGVEGVEGAKAVEGGILRIYTDGSTIGNGQRGAKSGYGVFFARESMLESHISRAVPRSEKQTNNVAELLAIYEGLTIGLAAPGIRGIRGIRGIMVYSDSNYSIDVITGKKNAHANLDLIDKIKRLLKTSSIPVEFHHVYAHTSKSDLHSLGNDIADYLAGQASAT